MEASVAGLPIVSPHGHTDPRWFAENAPFGNAAELLLLEKSVQRALRLAQPLPAIPACLNLRLLNADMPFRFRQERR